MENIARDVEHLWNVHEYIQEYVRFADTKAGVAIVVISTVLGLCYSKDMHHSFVSANVFNWGLVAWFSLLVYVALAASTLLATLVIVPRLTAAPPKGFVFWHSIAGHKSAQAFASELGNVTDDELRKHLAHQVYAISCICKQKYLFIKLSLWCGTPACMGAGALLLWTANP